MNRKIKFLLLFTLSLTSVYFAEVISGSFKYPLYDFWGYLGVIPIYGLHTIVLLFIIKQSTKDKAISLSVLYFAGVLFGLYEAYLTKVLWTGLSSDAFIFLNIAVFDFIVLVFFWHPIFSFIIPVIVFEALAAKDSTVFDGVPIKLKKLITKQTIVLVLILIGIIQALNSPNIVIALSSSLGTAIPMVLLYWVIQKNNLSKRFNLLDILPDKKEFIICAGILLIYYIGMGLVQTPEALTFKNQVTIWIIYVIFVLIFVYKLKRNSVSQEALNNPLTINTFSIGLFIISIVGGLTSLLWLLALRDVFMIVFWIAWIFMGLGVFTVALLKK